MELDIYQVDAFAGEVFSGNPAAICPLDQWLDDELMQKIALENNLSETAFFVRMGGGFALRWFSPMSEIDLCGHATLASAYVIFEYLGYEDDTVVFETQSGRLSVHRDGELFSMDFPSWTPKKFQVTERVSRALGDDPIELYSSRDILAVFENEAQILTMKPNFNRVAELDGLAIIATAPGDYYDFVSRVFLPVTGIPEDPVTGSAHCTLIPYWSNRLGKTKLRAYQASSRGGELICEDLGDRVKISGKAVCYMRGKIFI